MSTLHTVNKSPFERASMATCFAHVSSGDAVLIYEDGVYGARKGAAFAKSLEDVKARCAIFALGPDLAARGVKKEDLVEGVEVVGYDGFVDLVVGHARVCAWV